MLLFNELLAVKIGVLPAIIHQTGTELQKASAVEIDGKQFISIKTSTWIKLLPFSGLREIKESFTRLKEEGYIEKSDSFYRFIEPNSAIVPRVTPKPSSAIDELSDLQKERFKSFWEVYPKKVGYGAAVKSWKKVSPDLELTKTILEAVKESLDFEAWKSGFIPLPSTWLNQERWKDVVKVEVNLAYITEGMSEEEVQRYKEEYGL